MSNSSSPVCPRCGAPMANSSVEGLCAKCLGALNFATETILLGEGRTAQAAPLSVEQLAPHFPQLEILECLGRGGMGVVYKARQKSLNRLVALKLLAPERVTDAAFAGRFTREAHALAALNHPHIVTVYDFGVVEAVSQHPEGVAEDASVTHTSFYFLLMEFVDGVNLRQAMKAGRFTPGQALAVVPPVCEALQYAHDHGIVHRDIKPENLLLDKDGRVKIADFGIAKMLGDESTTGLAESQPAGTPQYMAPEQKEHQRTDHRADIYSLGVVLYEMLTGELPTDKLQPPSRRVQIDVRLDEIVLRALERTPELRYQTALEMRTQMEAIPSKNQAPETRAGTEAGDATPKPEVEPRLSRTAIWGVAWAPLFFITFVLVFWAVRVEGEYHGPTWWQYLLRFTLLPLGLAAPFGTTILGWISVAQIRRSAGKLHGLGLAVFDGLLFPLLTLDAAVFIIVSRWRGQWIVALKETPGTSVGEEVMVMVVFKMFVFVVCVLVDWLIIRWTWRAVKPPVAKINAPSPAPAITPSQKSHIKFGVFIGMVIVAGIFGERLLSDYLVRRAGAPIPEQLARNEITTHLQAASLRWQKMTFEPNTVLPSDIIVRFTGLEELRGENGANAWRPTHGILNLHAFDGRQWRAEGTELLGHIQFTFELPEYTPPVARSEYPKVGHITRKEGTVFIHHDDVDLHYVLFYPGEFGSSVGDSYNTHSLKWINQGSVKLKNGRTFGYLRESVADWLLSVNGQEFDLRAGRVFALHDDATVEQLNLFPSIATAGNPGALANLILASRAMNEGPVTPEKLRLQLDALETQQHDVLKKFAPSDQFAVEIRKSIETLQRKIKKTAVSAEASTVPDAFGPVIERMVNGAIDFDSGKQTGLPAAVTESSDIAKNVLDAIAWMEREGMDAITEPSRSLKAVGMKTKQLDNAAWNHFAPGELAATLAPLKAANWQDLGMENLSPVPDSLPKTYAFQTREGGMGMLQIIGSTDNGMKFRYKLVQSP